jgi:hypothetical protein
MLDPAQIAKPTVPKPLADLFRNRTNRLGPPPSPQPPRQRPNRPPELHSSLATNHSSLPLLIASEQNIKIQCKPLKTKNSAPC